ncbi:MAG TPA: molybdenum cofactor biosynthesis protein MoaE [Microlunatus sp.]|nr:molybdenum cofactor biosynthesis protein MoaE [Microlunatus sp.]
MSSSGAASSVPPERHGESNAVPRTYAAVVDTPLSVDALLARVSGPRVGGVGLFVGMIRDRDSDADVTSLDYSAHPSAEQLLRATAERVARAYDVLAVAVEHRIGHLAIGDLAVVVAVGAVHRAAALEACRRLIDDLKAEVPIWKEQHFVDGSSSWVGLG